MEKAVIASAVPVNKLLSGANWILQELGSSKRLTSWTPYAKVQMAIKAVMLL